MKKLTSTILLSLCCVSLCYAQTDESNSKAEKFKTFSYEKKFGFSINAVPILDWAGNLFNNSVSNTFRDHDNLYLTYNAYPMASVRYFLDNNTSLRLNLGVFGVDQTNNQYIQDDASNSPNDMLIDQMNSKYASTFLGLSYEKRRGENKVKGIYGAELKYVYVYDFYNEYSYANNFSATNISPTTYDWSNGNVSSQSTRVINESMGDRIEIGIRPYLGIEYFLSPQISIGTEIGLTLSKQKEDASTETFETFDISSGQTLTEVVKTEAESNSSSIYFDNYLSKITLTFIF